MRTNPWYRHLKQGGLFLIVGLAQLGLDSGVFVLMTALSMPVIASNLLGRISGAALGFWLNGRHTFSDNGVARLSPQHLRRFILAWLTLTAMSTITLDIVATHYTLHDVWLAKPLVEAIIAIIGFIAWRQWVFR